MRRDPLLLLCLTRKKETIAKRRKKGRKFAKKSTNVTEALSSNDTKPTLQRYTPLRLNARTSLTIRIRRPTQTEILVAEIKNIDQRLSTITDGQTDFHYLSTLCSRYSDIQATDIVAAADILDDAHTQISKLHHNLRQCQNELLNLEGLGKEYQTGEPSRLRMEGLMRELSDLEGHALLGPAELADLYAQSKLSFQL